ncbi:MAG TPA: prepilin-type N-terminal cleavage/methylation domain-containing protein [Candidatus Saccharimonas sp.]|jgi:prepilin-type N-terminal cleavage/methylation domain-containing protein|nr:prepilin-type N-terminal cleavage/methylation domain-containing protein [Candidatus Saccharimonas sp.]
MSRHRGFTIVEVVIVMVIMAILLTLTVVNLVSSQVNGRDAERKADADAIARGIEARYRQGNTFVTAPSYISAGSYPSVNEIQHILGQSVAGFSPAQITGGYLTDVLSGTSIRNFTAPGQTTTSFAPLCTASCQPAETVAVTATTTMNTYYYEPIDSAGNICINTACARFNLYYRLEGDGTLQTIRSEHQ